jgi:hypothetical protein
MKVRLIFIDFEKPREFIQSEAFTILTKEFDGLDYFFASSIAKELPNIVVGPDDLFFVIRRNIFLAEQDKELFGRILSMLLQRGCCFQRIECLFWQEFTMVSSINCSRVND